MVGSALLRRLEQEDCAVLTVGREEVDLTRQQAVEDWVAEARPQVIFLAAAKVGGIVANESSPVEFLYDNLAIAANVIHAAAQANVEKLLYLGSSCVYPKFAPQPITDPYEGETHLFLDHGDLTDATNLIRLLQDRSKLTAC
jgi:GDP-L-fucose synthase